MWNEKNVFAGMEIFFSQHLIKSRRLSRIQAYHCQGRQSRDAFMNGNTESLGLDFVRNILKSAGKKSLDRCQQD